MGSIATRDFKDVRACDLAPLLAPMDSSACISLSLEVRGPQTSGFPPTKQCEDISQEKSQEEYRLDQDETRTLKMATRDGYLVDAVVQTVNASKS